MAAIRWAETLGFYSRDRRGRVESMLETSLRYNHGHSQKHTFPIRRISEVKSQLSTLEHLASERLVISHTHKHTHSQEHMHTHTHTQTLFERQLKSNCAAISKRVRCVYHHISVMHYKYILQV